MKSQGTELICSPNWMNTVPFDFKQTSIDGLIVVQPHIFNDSRGYFLESYKKEEYQKNGINYNFVQDNQSKSMKGVLRGLHFQHDPMAQGKLVSVAKGKVWDVAVDLRENSKTYLEWFGVELSCENHTQLFIPPGFAHGFVTLEDNTIFQYKCTNYYSSEHDAGIRWDDPDINVKWPVKDIAVSEKDKKLPFLSEI